MWKGLLYVLDQTDVSKSLELPIEQIVQLAIVYINRNNGIIGNKQTEISNKNDIKPTLLKVLSNVIWLDISPSGAWKRMKALRAERVRNNQNKISGKTLATQIT